MPTPVRSAGRPARNTSADRPGLTYFVEKLDDSLLIFSLLRATGSIRRGGLRQWTALGYLFLLLALGLPLKLLRTLDQMAVDAMTSPFA
jgi:hypothetical protein